ncbi:MAG: thioredoxin family protein [Planctomycetaceae bacterium]|nr:thioredoxin family protein [Planctomycetaceae bacterium]
MTSPLSKTKKQYWPCCFVFALTFLVVFTAQIVAQTGIQWEKDFDKAKARAVTEKKPMLLHFYGDSCPPCQLMERDVFPKANVVEKMNGDFIAVKIDTSRSPQLMNQFGVRSIPTDIYLSPTGDKLHERSGRISATDFLAEMTAMAAKFPRSQPAQALQPLQVAQSPQNAGVALAEYYQPSASQTGNQGQPTGFSGYSAVAPFSQPPASPPQMQATSGESEGFAVSGNSISGNSVSGNGTAQQYSMNEASQFQQFQTQPGTMADSQTVFQAVPSPMSQSQFVPQTAGEQQFAVAQQPIQSVQLQQVVEPQFQVATQPSTGWGYQNPLHSQEQPMPHFTAVAQNPLVQQNDVQLTQPQSNQSGFTASSLSASPVVSVGSFESGMVRKQPTPGLGGGISLGVVAAVNDKPTEVQLPSIALDGFCPVSLAQTAKWVKGSAEITTEYDGVVFRFASVEKQNAFAVNPGLYAPVMRGRDAVELLTNRRDVSGQRKFGAWYHGHVFLFSNAENYEKFQNNPELYAFQANQSANSLAASVNPPR